MGSAWYRANPRYRERDARYRGVGPDIAARTDDIACVCDIGAFPRYRARPYDIALTGLRNRGISRYPYPYRDPPSISHKPTSGNAGLLSSLSSEALPVRNAFIRPHRIPPPAIGGRPAFTRRRSLNTYERAFLFPRAGGLTRHIQLHQDPMLQGKHDLRCTPRFKFNDHVRL